MNGYVENDSFAFGTDPNNETASTFDYNNISGLGESNYENEDLFNSEVDNNTQTMFEVMPQPSVENVQDNTQALDFNFEIPIEQQNINVVAEEPVMEMSSFVETPNDFYGGFGDANLSSSDASTVIVDEPIVQNTEVEAPLNIEPEVEENEIVEDVQPEVQVEFVTPSPTLDSEDQVLAGTMPEVEMNFEITKEPEKIPEIEPLPADLGVDTTIEDPLQVELDVNPPVEEPVVENKVNTEFLVEDENFGSLEDNIDYAPVEPVAMPSVEETITNQTITSEMMSNTPIEELNKLTEYKEEVLNTTDIRNLFNRVGVNVKEASDIFIKNTEMKEKLDIKFEELKKLQAEVEASKKAQLEEINAYKEEVLGKLTEKKDEIEKRINKLKDFQKNLEKEKEDFEKFRKTEREEIERVQKEVQEAYDSRREELNHIEDVLRKQKDALDSERSQLSLDRIQYESDKNELANNLLKFNEIVDSFTNGMDKVKEEPQEVQEG